MHVQKPGIKLLSRFPFLTGFFFILFSTVSFSQQSKENQSTSTDLQFDTGLGGVVYQDPLTGIALPSISPSEMMVDKSTYRLGPSDVISVSINANQQFSYRGLFVNPQGDIFIPGIGQISVSDLSINESEEKIREAASKTFRSPEVGITLDIAKPLTVYILGNIPEPGNKIVPGFTRADQVIAGALLEPRFNELGNPLPFQTSRLLESNRYSLRNTVIERGDGERVPVDLIDYFRAGNLDANPVLLNGDKIIIRQLNRMAPTVSISGAVKRQNEIEFKDGDTPDILLQIAGGYSNIADSSFIYIFRNSESGNESIKVPASDFTNFKIQPNDRLVVPEKETWMEPANAWISGEVTLPGNFPIKSGKTTIGELIEFAGGTTDQALLSAAYMVRGDGQINEIPDKFNTTLLKRTSDQLQQGFDYLELESQLSRNRIYLDLSDFEQLESTYLYNNDRIYIPRDEGTIFVFGQVNDPGYYPIEESGSINDFIYEAGGFALSADKNRVFIIKAGSGTWYKPGQTSIASGDRIFVDRIPFDELNALRTFEVQKQQIRNTRIQLILTGLTTITSIITAYVAITRN